MYYNNKNMFLFASGNPRIPKTQYNVLNPRKHYSKQVFEQAVSKDLILASKAGKMLSLQKNIFKSLGLSTYQKILINNLYCQPCISYHGTFATSDTCSQSTLKQLTFNILKQSYLVHYQNQLTFGFEKTKVKKQNIGVQLQSYSIGTQLIPSKLGKLESYLVLNKGTEFYSANWILYNLQQKLQTRNSNIKRAMQELFEKATLALDQKILQGLTIKISGMLTSRKQGMAKTMSKTIGVLPLSGLKQKVDYDQGFVITKLGSLGIKVWVFY